MKKSLLFIFILCFVQIVFTQENSKKLYQINNPSTQKEHYSLEVIYQLSNSEDGIMFSYALKDTLEIKVKKMNVKVSYKDVRSKNKISRYIEKNVVETEGLVMGKSMYQKQIDTFTGQSITFKRKNDLWIVPKFDSYNSIQQNSLKIYLSELNEGKSNRLQGFVYPERMQIGDVIQLDRTVVANFFDTHNIQSAEGKFELSDVIEEDGDIVAIFNVDFEIKALPNDDDVTLKFKGTIKRSISKFYDKEINLSGITISNMKEEKVIIKIPCKLDMTRKLF